MGAMKASHGSGAEWGQAGKNPEHKVCAPEQGDITSAVRRGPEDRWTCIARGIAVASKALALATHGIQHGSDQQLKGT